MIRLIKDNFSIFAPLGYLLIVLLSLAVGLLEESAGFMLLMLLTMPWSLFITIPFAWAIFHDGALFGTAVVLYLAGAVINALLIGKFAYSLEYRWTIGRD